MKDLSKTVGENIANLRKARGLTQGQLAERFAYTDKAISKWERGDVCPDVSTLQELADFFGVTMDYMTHFHTEQSILEDHSKDPATIRRNRIIMTALVSVFFWTVAAVYFSGFAMTHEATLGVDAYKQGSIAFAWAIPLTVITVTVYNYRFGKPVTKMPLFISVVWSLAIALYITFGLYANAWNLWFVLFVAVPLTIAFLIFYLSRSSKPKAPAQEENTGEQEKDCVQ